MRTPYLCGWKGGKASVPRLVLLFQAIGGAAVHAAEGAGAEDAGDGGGAVGDAGDAVGVGVFAAAFFVEDGAVAEGAGEVAVVEEGEEAGDAEASEEGEREDAVGAIGGEKEFGGEPGEADEAGEGEEKQAGAVNDGERAGVVAGATDFRRFGDWNLNGSSGHKGHRGFHSGNYTTIRLI